MREEESNWFSRWEEELPSPEELMPLSQTLITPDLAIAFDIRNPNSTTNTAHTQAAAPPPPPPPCSSSAAPSPPPSQPHSSDFDSTDIVSTAPGDEPARTLKRPRLVWTPQLHKRFVDAVAHLGIKNAVPKTIMQLMSVDGLTRENVASHLQKYRLYLKRMQGLSSGGVGNGGGNGALSPADAATDHLFASAPVPHHFLHPGRPPAASDHYLPFVPVTALQHHHQQQMAAAAVAAQQQYHHRQVGQFSSPPGRQFEHGFITGQQQQPVHRMGSTAAAVSPVPAHQPSFLDDLENGASGGGGGRKVLTLFPTGDD